LRVEPLRQSSADDLLRHLLGSSADLEPLKNMLLTRTEGNPFFAEESVR
jgi:predicted ATPase